MSLPTTVPSVGWTGPCSSHKPRLRWRRSNLNAKIQTAIEPMPRIESFNIRIDDHVGCLHRGPPKRSTAGESLSEFNATTSGLTVSYRHSQSRKEAGRYAAFKFSAPAQRVRTDLVAAGYSTQPGSVRQEAASRNLAAL